MSPYPKLCLTFFFSRKRGQKRWWEERVHMCRARSKAGTDQIGSTVDLGVEPIYPRFRQRESL